MSDKTIEELRQDVCVLNGEISLLRADLSAAVELVKRLTDYHPARSVDMGYAVSWLAARGR